MTIPRWDAIREAYGNLRLHMNRGGDDDEQMEALDALYIAVGEAMRSMKGEGK